MRCIIGDFSLQRKGAELGAELLSANTRCIFVYTDAVPRTLCDVPFVTPACIIKVLSLVPTLAAYLSHRQYMHRVWLRAQASMQQRQHLLHVVVLDRLLLTTKLSLILSLYQEHCAKSFCLSTLDFYSDLLTAMYLS